MTRRKGHLDLHSAYQGFLISPLLEESWDAIGNAPVIADQANRREGEPADIVNADDDEVIQPGKPLPEPRIPSSAEVAAHNLTHLPYRSWSHIASGPDFLTQSTGANPKLPDEFYLYYLSLTTALSGTSMTRNCRRSSLPDCTQLVPFWLLYAQRKALRMSMLLRDWQHSSSNRDIHRSFSGRIKRH